jgi:hypothetical protein
MCLLTSDPWKVWYINTASELCNIGVVLLEFSKASSNMKALVVLSVSLLTAAVQAELPELGEF